MLKTNNYEQVLKTIQAIDATNRSSSLRHLQKILTINYIEELEFCIRSGNTLYSYRKSHNIDIKTCSILFNEALPLLFSDKEIDDYFLGLLLNKYNDLNTWQRPIKAKFFFDIIGQHFAASYNAGFYYSVRFHEVWDNVFIPNYWYPEAFKQETINLINKNESLSSNYKEFKYKLFNNKSLIGDDSYLVYLDTYIIDKIGEDFFRQYIKNIIDRYMESLSIRDIRSLTNDKLLDYIFGYSWKITTHIYNRDSNRLKYIPKHYRLHIILLEIFLPKTIGNYRSKKSRYQVYEILNLSEEKIQEYEYLANATNINSGLNSINAEYNLDSIKLPSNRHFSYVFNCVDMYFEKIKNSRRIEEKKEAIFNNIKNNSTDKLLVNDLKYIYRKSSYRSTLFLYIENKIIKTKSYFYECNKEELIEKKDFYVIYYKNKENYVERTINLASLNSNLLKKEIRIYIRTVVTKNKHNSEKINRIIRTLSFIESEFEIKKTQDINEWHILECLHHIEVEKAYSPSTIKSYLGNIKQFIFFLMDSDYSLKPLKNPALGIKLSNIREHIDHTPVIPDDILVFLDNHIDELRQKDYKLIYKILIQTGWRFGDIRELLSKDIEKIPNNNEFASIRVSSPKTKKSRINRGFGDKLDDVISIDLYNEIQEYINETQVIRDMYGIETLFFSIQNNAVSSIHALNFNIALNNLCKKYNIKSIDATYWRISSKQTRKTVASTLISNGASTAAVQKKLGHVLQQTTDEYYAEVQRKKIGELNTEFYKRKFDIYMDKEKLKLFTEEERKILYIDFCMNKRNVELGVCSKHPSEGRCTIMGYMTCASCPKICTGKKYLSQWKKLADDSQILLAQFVTTYEKHNISKDEYNNYIEYKQELNLYNHYIEVIKAIEKEK